MRFYLGEKKTKKVSSRKNCIEKEITMNDSIRKEKNTGAFNKERDNEYAINLLNI